MVAKSMQRDRTLKSWLGAVLLAVWVFLFGVSPIGAQSRTYRVAVLTPGLTFSPVLEGLQTELVRLGYVPGENLTLMVEDTQGEVSDLGTRAARLVEANPDVLVTVATGQAAAAKQATTTVPIVFTVVGDPLRSGLIASYASSKNNLTGISSYAGPLSGKRLETLKEIAPGIKKVLAIVAAHEDVSKMSFQFLEESAHKLGIELLRHDVTTKEEIEQGLQGMLEGSVDAICHVPSALVSAHLELLIQKAKEDRLPLVVPDSSMVEKGALVSYGADFRPLGAQAAKLVAKVLKGTKPSEIPIQTPEKLILAINLTTAKAIGLEIPRAVLEKTDRFVE